MTKYFEVVAVPPKAIGARGRGLPRLVIGLFALAGLAYGVAHADRLPGNAGEMIRANVAADRDATALFYTEVDGWTNWLLRKTARR